MQNTINTVENYEYTMRCELSLLERREGELVKALCDVRHAAEAQRIKIKELVKGLPSPIRLPIDRLPNELLLSIVNLAIHATTDLIMSKALYEMAMIGKLRH